MLATICREIDDGPKETVRLSLGEIPILVKSQKCHLYNLSSEGKILNNKLRPCIIIRRL